ncbi:uncharacterized protein LOC111601702 [Drosophila hydei]|uniref:Uncharacterized protein LOC111601702 n=1 Tax=Drosophila hydei TaxID=7224 RepID=A0A6J1M0B5_DROHY|nr:uncharacterized protein LOC111601702 [Drosophila hydei]
MKMSKCSRLQQEIQLLRNELEMIRAERDELSRQHGSHFQLCTGCEVSAKKPAHNVSGSKTPNQELYIAYLEDQIQRTRFMYKKQMGEVKCSAGLLETKLQNVRMEMSYISEKAQKVDQLQKSIRELKSKLTRRDSIITRYNEQHAAFLDLINALDSGSNSQKDVKRQFQNYFDFKNSGGCAANGNNSVIRLRCKPSESLNFPCLGTALRRKLARN